MSAAKAMVAPHLRRVMICVDECPWFVESISSSQNKEKGVVLESTTQFGNSIKKKGNQTYVAALIEIKPNQWVQVPDEVAGFLDEFGDTMPDELPKELPPRRAIDQWIELVPGAVLPAKATYKMGALELEELSKQLNGMVESGYMVPSKTPYGALVLFQKKSDGSLRINYLEEHLQHLRKVLIRLKEEKLYIKKEKCEFCRKEVKFLGHWVGQGKLRMDEGNIKAIMDWPIPTKVAELRSFLGLANYYRKFIKGYSKRTWEANQVADALSRKDVHAFVGALTQVSTTFFDRVREQSLLDPGYKKLLEEARNGELVRYWEEYGILYANGGRLFVPNNGTLRRELLKETHDTKWAGHPDKTERRQEVELLQPLPIPEKPWQSISTDFIVGCPEVKGFRSILVVVDRFLKYGIFIPAHHACPADVAAELIMKNVVKYFGLPEDIINDRDSKLTGRFWTTLFNMPSSDRKFSTANHPQTNGQTERMHHCWKEYLPHYVTASQRNWV
uniref:Integrase catalytic domain-containing protein n=1 Tax=Cannabis sativa TaxID=3483 RepID=A0A803Q628_CANSA